MRDFHQAVWQALAGSGIPHTYHWGKMFPIDPVRVRAMYGAAIDTWAAARHTLLPTPELRRAFTNPMMQSLQLDP
jgi:hypothetical protein